MGSYGCSFAEWIATNNPRPYNSFGNGSAMRVSAIGWLFDTLEQVEEEAMLSAMPTHNHPKGIKGAVATASAIFLARIQGKEAMLEAMKSYYSQWKEPCLGEKDLTRPVREQCLWFLVLSKRQIVLRRLSVMR